jgi:hypothetical protein
MALSTLQPTDPTNPWDPTSGCQACCSGTPFPTQEQFDVIAVDL